MPWRCCQQIKFKHHPLVRPSPLQFHGVSKINRSLDMDAKHGDSVCLAYMSGAAVSRLFVSVY